MMDNVLGFVVATLKDRNNAFWKSYASFVPEEYCGISSYDQWPLDSEMGPDALLLWNEGWEYGIFSVPDNARNIMGVTQDLDYVRRYVEVCKSVGLQPFILALGDSGMNLDYIEMIKTENSIGFECINQGEYLVSYLFCDNGWEKEGDLHEELSAAGIRFNRNGLFESEEEAQKYGEIRRCHIENGENWEDCGLEMAVKVSIVELA